MPGEAGRATEGEGSGLGLVGRALHGTETAESTVGGYCGNTEGANRAMGVESRGMGDKCLEGRTDGIRSLIAWVGKFRVALDF